MISYSRMTTDFKPLEQVGQYVKSHERLRGVFHRNRSQKERRFNRRYAGEIASEKVEEMTLYMVEMKKENDELKAGAWAT